MRPVRCDRCGAEFPVADTFRTPDETLCAKCFESAQAGGELKGLTEREIRRQVDPTVCINCRTDFGERELVLLAGLPTCDACADQFRRRPFPMWLKVAFVGLLGLAAFSLVRNLRFFQGYDVPTAHSKMAAAADHIPELPDLRTGALFYKGLHLLTENKSAQAVEIFRQCRKRVPGSADALAYYLLVAEAYAAFDQGDYDAMLNTSIRASRIVADTSTGEMLLASAYACKYASTGDESYRLQAVQHLDKAKQLAGDTDPDLPQFEQRMHHRLTTREIISREEFARRFPNGWPEGTHE